MALTPACWREPNRGHRLLLHGRIRPAAGRELIVIRPKPVLSGNGMDQERGDESGHDGVRPLVDEGCF